jgi:hypothetical protein
MGVKILALRPALEGKEDRRKLAARKKVVWPLEFL